MTEKLIELRQRFRGYQPVRTEEEDSSGDDDGDDLGALYSAQNSNRRSTTGFSLRQSNYITANERAKPKSYFCKYALSLFMCFSLIVLNSGTKVILGLSISGIIFLSIIVHMLDSDNQYLKIHGTKRKKQLAGGVIGAIYLYILTAMCCIYIIMSSGSSRNESTTRITD